MKRNIKLRFLVIFALLISINQSFAQVTEDSELYISLQKKDSLLFEESFNKCNIDAIKDIIADDLEFYHDLAGIINTKEKFLSNLKNGLCNPQNNTKSRRELIGKLSVFPLYNNGELYGAIQNGVHQFYETTNGIEQKGSTANFSHLWILEKNEWKLKRVLSYNHTL